MTELSKINNSNRYPRSRYTKCHLLLYKYGSAGRNNIQLISRLYITNGFVNMIQGLITIAPPLHDAYGCIMYISCTIGYTKVKVENRGRFCPLMCTKYLSMYYIIYIIYLTC